MVGCRLCEDRRSPERALHVRIGAFGNKNWHERLLLSAAPIALSLWVFWKILPRPFFPHLVYPQVNSFSDLAALAHFPEPLQQLPSYVPRAIPLFQDS